MKNPKNYAPYEALEFHLNNSIELHNVADKKAMKRSDAEYHAAMLAQQVQMDDKDLLEGYRQFCKDNNLKAQL